MEATRLEHADLSEHDAEQLAKELPDDLLNSVQQLVMESRAFACIAIDIVERYQRASRDIGILLWRETGKYENGGDVVNTVIKAMNLDVVGDVLEGLASVIRIEPADDGLTVRHHAADHRREIGRPALVLWEQEAGR